MNENIRGALKTLAWVGGYLVLFELAVALAGRVPALRDHRVMQYLDYGTSIETKIRRMAEDPDLPERSVFYAGWLDSQILVPAGAPAGISVYGMSYAGNLAATIREVAPDVGVLSGGGPGVPLSHSYTAFKNDSARPRSRVVLIPLLTGGVYDMAGMTHDSRFADHSQPATWPRYAIVDGRLGELAYPVIDSAEKLRRAVTGQDRALWERHLAQLERFDVNFRRWLYTSHWTERLAIGRLIRRAQGQANARENARPIGAMPRFHRDAEASQVQRAMLRQFIADVRARGETPLVVLFAELGKPEVLFELVRDVLEDTQVDYLKSEDFCSATDPSNYGDMHLMPQCDRAMAESVLEFYHSLASPAAASRASRSSDLLPTSAGLP